MPKQASEIKDDEAALLAVCGSDSMVDRVKSLWDDIMEKKRLDVSNQGLTDDAVGRLLKGLHMCASVAAPDALRTHESPRLMIIQVPSAVLAPAHATPSQDVQDDGVPDGAHEALPDHRARLLGQRYHRRGHRRRRAVCAHAGLRRHDH
ncbi:hypothetical protein OAO87_00880 [bacterium]|nr:hypothetical protein [bacterium]